MMIKAKLMNLFKEMFGGKFIKENGKIYWIKDGFKEFVSTSFLRYFIEKKKDPSVNDQSTVVSQTVSTVVSETVSTVKQPPKKVKKNAKSESNPDVSQGS